MPKKSSSTRIKKVNSTPKGYHSITPYLIVKNAKAAIQFYKKIFKAKEMLRINHGKDKVGHAELMIGDGKIMIADEFPAMDLYGPKKYKGSPVSIHLYVKNVDTVVKKALTAKATLLRPVEDMFFGDRGGTIEDPFGHRWHISTHIKNVALAQIKKRAKKMFA